MENVKTFKRLISCINNSHQPSAGFNVYARCHHGLQSDGWAIVLAYICQVLTFLWSSFVYYLFEKSLDAAVQVWLHDHFSEKKKRERKNEIISDRCETSDLPRTLNKPQQLFNNMYLRVLCWPLKCCNPGFNIVKSIRYLDKDLWHQFRWCFHFAATC